MTRAPDAGVVLINVLVVLGLATTVVYGMLTLSDLSIARSQRFSEAGQGQALVRGAEQSAIAALRRDMIEAPDVDHAAEAWSGAAQQAIEVAGGTFELQIEDAQGLLNLNNLGGGGLQAEDTLHSIGEALALPPETAERILASLAADGPLRQLEDLAARAGVAPEDIAMLATLATVLPVPSDVNINAAPLDLLAALLKNPAEARRLVNTRDSAGFLTPQDIESNNVLLPSGIGYRSDLYRVRTTVRIGETVQSVESLLRRRTGQDGPVVEVIGRRNAMAAVLPPPPSS